MLTASPGNATEVKTDSYKNKVKKKKKKKKSLKTKGDFFYHILVWLPC